MPLMRLPSLINLDTFMVKNTINVIARQICYEWCPFEVSFRFHAIAMSTFILEAI